MKAERLITLMLDLISHKKLSASELARRYQVSVRTIQRDVDALVLMGIPIEAQLGSDGGYFINESYKITGQTFTKKEHALIVQALKSIQEHVDDPDLNRALTKLNAIKACGQTLEPRWVDIASWEKETQFEDVIGLIKTCIVNKNRISFTYIKPDSGRDHRKVDPLRLLLKGYDWYLYAFCHLRRDYRLFKVARMGKVVGLSENAYTEFEGDVPFSYGPASSHPIRIRVHESIFYQGETFIDPAHVQIDDQGYFITDLPFEFDQWTLGYLMARCDYMQVLGPAHVVESLREKAKKLALLYENYDTN